MADTEFDVNIVVNESVNPDVGETEYEGGLSIDDSVLSLSAESSEDTIVDAEISNTEAIDVEVEDGVGGTGDHRKLLHRDATNQHPISAIQGLTSSLESLQQSINNGLTDANQRITSVSGVATLAKKYDIVEYAKSSSNTTAPESGWSSKAPTLDGTNKYMWQRVSTYEKVASGDDLYISSNTPELATTMSGVYIFTKQANDGSATVINGGSIVADTLDINKLSVGLRGTINGKAEQSSLDATNLTVATKANQSALDATNNTVSALQQIVDNTIETWFYSGVPTLSNLPASQWTTDVEKDRHLGDLYYDNATGYAYRFLYNDSTDVYFWQQLSDSAVAEALSKANAAQATANVKKRIFIAQPTTPYEVGDLWCNTSGDTKVCTTARATGSYVSTDWEKSSKYTDDTLATAVQTDLANNYTNTSGMNTAISDAVEVETARATEAEEDKVDSAEYQNMVSAVESNTTTLGTLGDTVVANKTAVDDSLTAIAQDIINSSLILQGKASIETDSLRIFDTLDYNTFVEITGLAVSMIREGMNLLTLTTYKGKGTIFATDALFSTLKMRSSSTDLVGKAGIVGESNGHLSIKAVD